MTVPGTQQERLDLAKARTNAARTRYLEKLPLHPSLLVGDSLKKFEEAVYELSLVEQAEYQAVRI